MPVKFKVGDHVVHPQHGVGHVVELTEREFSAGIKQWYYEVAISGGSIVWVPLDLSISGLRRLAEKRQIILCRKILADHPCPLTEDSRFRRSELASHLKQGAIQNQCEVVRDLFAFGEHRSLNGIIGIFYRSARDVLCQEWAVVEGITLAEASGEIDLLLNKGRNTLRESKM